MIELSWWRGAEIILGMLLIVLGLFGPMLSNSEHDLVTDVPVNSDQPKKRGLILLVAGLVLVLNLLGRLWFWWLLLPLVVIAYFRCGLVRLQQLRKNNNNLLLDWESQVFYVLFWPLS